MWCCLRGMVVGDGRPKSEDRRSAGMGSGKPGRVRRSCQSFEVKDYMVNAKWRMNNGEWGAV